MTSRAGRPTSQAVDRLGVTGIGEVLADLRAAGAEWVQLDEPALVRDRTPAELNATARAYRELSGLADRPKLLVASYFDRLGAALPTLVGRLWTGSARLHRPGRGQPRRPRRGRRPARQAAGRRGSSTGATSGST